MTMEQAIKKHVFLQEEQRILTVNPFDAKVAKCYLAVAFISLLIGGFLGLFQGLERAGVFQLPPWLNYYQVLTAHGVLLLLFFSATFTIGSRRTRNASMNYFARRKLVCIFEESSEAACAGWRLYFFFWIESRI